MADELIELKSNIKTNSATNEVCRNCLKYHQFQDSCWVHWHGKKFCTMKVETHEDWQSEKNILNK